MNGSASALLLGLWLAGGCQSPPGPTFDARAPGPVQASALMMPVESTNHLDPEWLHPSTNAFTLGPGDRVEIEILNDPESRATTTVGPDGRIYYHLLSGLDVWGMTLPQAKQRLESELLNFIRDGPKVSITLRAIDSKRVWMLGRLNTPGVYPMVGPTTLLEAISLAGGPSSAASAALASSASSANAITIRLNAPGSAGESADLRRAFVMRQGHLLPVNIQRLLKEGDMSQNVYLEPDDFVYVPSAAAQSIHVLGAVAQPKAVPATHELTLIAAVANAGGTIKDAYLSHVAVVRGALTQPQVAVIDFKAIIQGREPDVVLEPHDIVYVPFSPYRVLTRYVDIILDTFVRTVGANAGTRVVIPGAAPVGPNVPIGP